MAQAFKSGDVVQLRSGGPKSGGPKMVVDRYVKRRVCCQWFSGDKLQSASFPEVSLQSELTVVKRVIGVPRRRNLTKRVSKMVRT
jgi:uncharacterized protein YodC (DUF2158 family)